MGRWRWLLGRVPEWLVLITMDAAATTLALGRGVRSTSETDLILAGVCLLEIGLVLLIRTIRPRGRGRPRRPFYEAFEMFSLVVFYVALWSSMDWQLAHEWIGCFGHHLTKIDSVYFALTTFTSTGYGDIHPVSQTCRAVVSGQLFSNLAVVAVVITVAVGRFASSRN